MAQLGIEDRIVEEIIQRVLRVVQPERIILFGSAASGQMNRDSDIDLLIVEKSPGNTREEGVRIRDALGKLGYPIDVIVIASERLDAGSGTDFSLCEVFSQLQSLSAQRGGGAAFAVRCFTNNPG